MSTPLTTNNISTPMVDTNMAGITQTQELGCSGMRAKSSTEGSPCMGTSQGLAFEIVNGKGHALAKLALEAFLALDYLWVTGRRKSRQS
jgi:hypothetical protein